MIAISKEEKEIILSRHPHTHVVRTMRQKSKRHKYYCTETRSVMKTLAELRGWEEKGDKREGGGYKSRKKRK